jgi:SAM-dependent methyltransferase
VSGFRWEVHPDRLNLGCGWDRREGYTNVDLLESHRPDLVADIRELGMLPSDHYREILASDCLEHLPRTDTDRALREWYRLLAPGGVLRLRVPDFAGIVRMMEAATTVEQQQSVVQHLFGTQAYTGDFHHTTFTDLTLLHHLGTAGFTDASLSGRDGWLFEGEARKPADPAEVRLGISWRAGFHGLEETPQGSYRWCAEEGQMLLVNPAARPTPVRLSGDADAIGRRRSTLWLEALGERLGHRVGRERVHLALELTLPPGGTLVRLRTDAPRVEGGADPRRLHFRLWEARLEGQPSSLAAAG